MDEYLHNHGIETTRLRPTQYRIKGHSIILEHSCSPHTLDIDDPITISICYPRKEAKINILFASNGLLDDDHGEQSIVYAMIYEDDRIFLGIITYQNFGDANYDLVLDALRLFMSDGDPREKIVNCCRYSPKNFSYFADMIVEEGEKDIKRVKLKEVFRFEISALRMWNRPYKPTHVEVNLKRSGLNMIFPLDKLNGEIAKDKLFVWTYREPEAKIDVYFNDKDHNKTVSFDRLLFGELVGKLLSERRNFDFIAREQNNVLIMRIMNYSQQPDKIIDLIERIVSRSLDVYKHYRIVEKIIKEEIPLEEIKVKSIISIDSSSKYVLHKLMK